MGTTLLRYPYEVLDPKEYFEEIEDVKVTKDMLDLARHIVDQKSGSFEPEFRGNRFGRTHQPKASGQAYRAKAPSARYVVDLMDALRKSIGCTAKSKDPKTPTKKAKKAAAGQKELMMPIEGKKPAKSAAAKKSKAGARRKTA